LHSPDGKKRCGSDAESLDGPLVRPGVMCIKLKGGDERMKLKVIIHELEEGGYWAEVPSIPGCATQGETFDELLSNIYEAVEDCLSIDMKDIKITEKDKVLEIAV